jgi:hypothetical protein
VKLRILGLILVATAAVGCAPQFIDVPPTQRKAMWIERDAITTHAAIGNSEQSEIVLSNVANDQRLNPEERVIWVSGVDMKKSRLQRTMERIGDSDAESNAIRVAQNSAIVESHYFTVVGSSLGAKGQLSIQKFKANETGRFYVEFLNDGPMTEERVNHMMTAWRELAARLKERGLNTANVIMGGAKYEQPINAIVLVKVGK